MRERTFNVLFLCTGNSARSIMAEGLLAHLGRGRFNAHSAGSHPTGTVNPAALSTLAAMHIPTDGFRSKSWDEFARPGAPPLDLVITVCDNAAGETCPLWPGQPATAHWGVPDPAAFQGSDEQKAKVFMSAALTLRRRIELMLALPQGKLAGPGLQGELRRIGRVEG
ncbi:MAG: arsenate reductase ArsC [Burkholderiales bacterium]|nr:arsenate reductase ArsC [Burkholderiales bacterium]